jgi:hypothetical protein
MFKRFKEDKVFRETIAEDVRNIVWVALATFIIGLPLTYLMYHPLFY